jgi:DNA-binding beta-propeller fold protein YncE
MSKMNFFKKTVAAVTVAAMLPATVMAAEGAINVSTFVGTGGHGYRDGATAHFNIPANVFGGSGNQLFVADTFNNLIRAVTTHGVTSRIVGDIVGYDEHNFPHGFHRDGATSEALFNRPTAGLVADDGRVFIVDSRNHAIRMMDRTRVYTFVGREAGFADGNFETARLNNPTDIAAYTEGKFVIADTGNHSIRLLDSSGNISTIAGEHNHPGYVDGPLSAARFNSPMGVAVSEDGERIFVADTGNHLIRVIENGVVSTLAGTPTPYEGEDDFGDGPVMVGGFANGEDALFNLPMGITVSDDMLIVADNANHLIRAVSLIDGNTTTLAGSGEIGYRNGSAEESTFHFPSGVYVMADVLYIADSGNNVIRRMPLK